MPRVTSTYHLQTSKRLQRKRCAVQLQAQTLLKRTRWTTEPSLNQTRAKEKCFLPAAGWRQVISTEDKLIQMARRLFVYSIMTLSSPASFYGIIITAAEITWHTEHTHTHAGKQARAHASEFSHLSSKKGLMVWWNGVKNVLCYIISGLKDTVGCKEKWYKEILKVIRECHSFSAQQNSY